MDSSGHMEGVKEGGLVWPQSGHVGEGGRGHDPAPILLCRGEGVTQPHGGEDHGLPLNQLCREKGHSYGLNPATQREGDVARPQSFVWSFLTLWEPNGLDSMALWATFGLQTEG